MKLLSYALDHNMEPRLAFLCQGQAVDVMRAAFWLKDHHKKTDFIELPSNMRNLLDDWTFNFPLLKELGQVFSTINLYGLTLNSRPIAHALDDIVLFPPIPDPPSFRDFYAFEQHVKTARHHRGLEMVPEWYQFPVFYFSNHNALLGHQWPLRKPKNTTALDYELELGCVIGKGGRDIPAEHAEQHIAGFTILNDWSARDIQREEMKVGLGPAKGKDFGTSLGPFLVTIDEFESVKVGKSYNLTMIARRNGVELSRGNAQNLYYSFGEMIARASEGVELFPGDVIGSGTVGTGCILELQPENAGGWLEVGDTIELEIQGIGTLTNSIVAYDSTENLNHR